MKRLNLLFFFFLFCLPLQYGFGQNNRIMNDNDIVSSPEKIPEFPGGISALYKFLQDNINYPTIALVKGVYGVVSVEFVVEKDGSITNIRVVSESTKFEIQEKSQDKDKKGKKNKNKKGAETEAEKEIDHQDAKDALCAESLRVIKSMPHWIPGTSEGKPVRCFFRIPITFML